MYILKNKSFFKKSSKNKVKVGDLATDFTLPSQLGKTYKLKDMLFQNLVLYFYPKDDSPGCTAEACAFRDNYEVFKKHGAEVVGISSYLIDKKAIVRHIFSSQFNAKKHINESLKILKDMNNN